MSDTPNSNSPSVPSLTQAGKYLIIVTAFLGWFFGGTHMAITGLAMRTAALELLYISGGQNLTDADQETIAALKKSLDQDGDEIIQTSHFIQAGNDNDGTKITKENLTAVGLKKNPDEVKVLGEAGDQDGVISDQELQRYVIDDRLGPLAGSWFG